MYSHLAFNNDIADPPRLVPNQGVWTGGSASGFYLRPCVQRLWDCSWTVTRDIPEYELPPSSSSFMFILGAQSSASPYDAENQSVQSDSPSILLGISDWSYT